MVQIILITVLAVAAFGLYCEAFKLNRENQPSTIAEAFERARLAAKYRDTIININVGESSDESMGPRGRHPHGPPRHGRGDHKPRCGKFDDDCWFGFLAPKMWGKKHGHKGDAVGHEALHGNAAQEQEEVTVQVVEEEAVAEPSNIEMEVQAAPLGPTNQQTAADAGAPTGIQNVQTDPADVQVAAIVPPLMMNVPATQTTQNNSVFESTNATSAVNNISSAVAAVDNAAQAGAAEAMQGAAANNTSPDVVAPVALVPAGSR